MVTELIGRTIVPVLVTVTVFAALVVFRTTLPKDNDVRDTEKLDRTPVPESVTRLVPAPLPVDTVTLATLVPTLVGLNFTLIVHVAPTATDVPQLLNCENCVAFVPVTEIDVIRSDVAPVFFSVNDLAADVTFSALFPKASELTDKLKDGIATI